jgi:hypothetical protein
MTQIHFDRLHSVTTQGNHFLVRMLDPQGNRYEWTCPRELATLLVLELQQVAASLPETDQQQLISVTSISSFVGPGMVSGIQIQLAPQLYVNLLLPRKDLDALATVVAQLKSATTFGGPQH